MDLWKIFNELQWLDLSHSLSEEAYAYSPEESFSSQRIAEIETHGYQVDRYQLASQFGTHIDAPSHFFQGGKTLEQFGLQDLILPLYVLHFEAEVEENPDFLLTKEAIQTYEGLHGRIPPESFVAFASNWSARWGDEAAFYNLDQEGYPHRPGWSLEALQYLQQERQVRAIGHECFDTDRAIDIARKETYPAQSYWLSQNNYQVELLINLSTLPTRGALILLAPLKIQGGPGSPVRAMAFYPRD